MTNTKTQVAPITDVTRFVDMQKAIEQSSSSLVAAKRRLQLDSHIKSGSEFNLSYGKKAVIEILPIVEKYLLEMNTKRNQHHKLFFWDIVRPLHQRFVDKADTEITVAPATTLSEIVAINLVGHLSRETTLTQSAANITKSAMYSLNVPLDTRKDYNESAIQLFSNIILHISENSSIYTVDQVNGREYRLFLSEKWKKIVEEASTTFLCNNDSYAPMIIKPTPHTNLISGRGGYLITESPLRKNPHKEKGKIDKDILNFNSTNNPEYFEIINRTQETPYCVNIKLLKVLREYYEMGITFPSFPSVINDEFAEEAAIKEVSARNAKRMKFVQWLKGVDVSTLKKEKSRIKMAKMKETLEYSPLTAGTVRDIHRKHHLKELEAVRKTKELFDQADTYSGFGEMYYPIFTDHRDRRYPYVSNGLTYQGDEMAKALVQFANKRVLTQEGLIAMFETLGNTLGKDKLKVAQKSSEAFVWWEENRAAFEAGDFSMFFLQSKNFDEPVNALAIVMELIEVYKNPEGYECGYINHRDARCSGASIIGTSLQDREVMRMTSVIEVPEAAEEEKLPDLYIFVADFARDICDVKVEEGDVLAMALKELADELFNRAVFKTPTMTKSSYGLTDYALKKSNKDVIDWEDEELGLSAEHKIAFDNIMLQALAEAVPSSKGYLEAIKKIGRTVVERDSVIKFISPITQAPIILHSFKKKVRRLEVKLGFARIQLNINSWTKLVDKEAVVREAAPSVIHHLDSALLYMVNKFLPTTELAMIHDSIGSHPNDTKSVVGAYGKAMYIYAKTDVLNKIVNQFGVEDTIPTVNTCSPEDLQSILTSQHILA